MASACVNNNAVVGVTEFSSFAWLSPPRLSFTRDRDRDDVASSKTKPNSAVAEAKSDLDDDEEAYDFEFCLEDPVASVMLPADELFSDGKLMPMPTTTTTTGGTLPVPKKPEEIVVIQTSRRITEILTGSGAGGEADSNLFSPRAPRCASRWKEIFGLKKLHHNSTTTTTTTTQAKTNASTNNNRSLKNFLHRKSKSDAATGLSLPLMRDTDCESLSVSSRLSLSSSSSGHELEDFPRLSLDVDKHNNINPISLLKSVANPNNHLNPPPRVRLNAGTRMGKSPMRRTALAATEPAVSYADSPRMHPSGKIVFHGLERSSSSPGSFNGGPRFKHSISGMERSYSASVRVAPVLNVPVCSLSKSGNVLGGLGQLFSNSNSNGGSSTSNSRGYQSINNSNINNRRNRTRNGNI